MENVPKEDLESFRDHVDTIGKDGKRVWIYPQEPTKGRLYRARKIIGSLLLLIFFILPFIRFNGEPLFLLNVSEGKFILFGVVFWPQDFFLFGLGMMIFVIFIALFTVIYGRIFCGWACPHTLFLEIIFRRIEHWVEGDARHQKQLNEGPWTSLKIGKKLVKNLAFIFVSFILTVTFFEYFVGVDGLWLMLSDPFSKHMVGFIVLFSITILLYGIYARFREQMCLIVCPYGRLQGVLLDRNSIMVAYDYLRGEPRGHVKKNNERLIGDCIDCALCVKACPTGIDIRNGTQLECVNCTACMDACDIVMEKTGTPKGLIRFASENGIANKERLKITARIIGYSSILLILIAIEVFLLASRSDLDTTVIRARGLLYQEQPGNKISNLYTIQLVNKTRKELPVELRVEAGPGEIRMVGKKIDVHPESQSQGEFFVVLNRMDIHKRKTNLEIGVYSGNRKIKTVETSFLAPVPRN
jgi:cytochrome c oxidase accessory protein FixG